jgi:hypothetical protein
MRAAIRCTAGSIGHGGGKMSEYKDKPISEGPAIKEETWMAATLASAVIAVAIVVFCAFYTFCAPDPEAMARRAQALSPFGTCLLAFVTFCGVMWRGMLTTRQANEQRRQNDANEEVNYGKVLQEGAKLIGEKGNEAHRLAGIASLATLFSDPKGRFGVNAMDLLANFIAANYNNNDMTGSLEAGIHAMRRGKVSGFSSNIPFDGKVGGHMKLWAYAPGFRSYKFCRGSVDANVLSDIQRENTEFIFTEVNFDNVTIDEYFEYYIQACIFVKCNIKNIDYHKIAHNYFYNCNFSGCYFEGDRPELGFDDLTVHQGNYYINSTPPIFEDGKAPPIWLKGVDFAE